MTGAEVVSLLGLVLPLVVKYVPGLLASITGHESDEAALAHAKAKIGALRMSPAQHAIDDELAKSR